MKHSVCIYPKGTYKINAQTINIDLRMNDLIMWPAEGSIYHHTLYMWGLCCLSLMTWQTLYRWQTHVLTPINLQGFERLIKCHKMRKSFIWTASNVTLIWSSVVHGAWNEVSRVFIHRSITTDPSHQSCETVSCKVMFVIYSVLWFQLNDCIHTFNIFNVL